MKQNSAFFNEFGRLRSGWRFAAFFITFIIAAVVLMLLGLVLLNAFGLDAKTENSATFALQQIVTIIAAVFFGWLFGKIFEDLPFRALGCALSKNWLRDLSFGLLLGTASLVMAALIAFIFGGLRFEIDRDFSSTAILTTLSTSLGVFILGAAAEEVMFRGYLLQTFARANLAWFAVGLTAVFFASAHLGNKNANAISTINTALAGIWLGAAYLKTRNLWFPFGIHLMWNWFQGAIFGVEVSGITKFTTAPLLREIDSGPAWLTGETYGLEGGIACTFALIISLAVIYFLPNLEPAAEMLALTGGEKIKNLASRSKAEISNSA